MSEDVGTSADMAWVFEEVGTSGLVGREENMLRGLDRVSGGLGFGPRWEGVPELLGLNGFGEALGG